MTHRRHLRRLHSSSTPWFRRLRHESLEDRRMLSATLFVDADAPVGGDGLGWATAYLDLESALGDAAVRNSDTSLENDVDQIWIAEGTYRPTNELQAGDARSASFSLVNGVSLYGGFAGTETILNKRNSAEHETVLSGDLGILDNSSDNAFTVVYCGSEVEATIDGMTVSSGNADGSYLAEHLERQGGGGVFNLGTLTIANCTVSRNTAVGAAYSSGGGGVCNHQGRLTLTNSVVSHNAVENRGGGVYIREGVLTISESVIEGNLAENDGGGVSIINGELMITNSILRENIAGVDGGAVYSVSDTATIRHSTISRNSAGEDGGGISVFFGLLTVVNTTLSRNTAERWGGGAYDHLGSAFTSINSVFASNSARHGGGGICSPGTLTVMSSTLTENSAEYGVGGISAGENFTLVNSIVTLNDTEDIGGAISDDSTNNLIGGDPRFVRRPGTIGADDEGDLRLTAESAAIDAGALSRLPDDSWDLDGDGDTSEPLPTDLDGSSRQLGFSLDIGAYESQSAPADGREIPSTTVTTAIDAFDAYDGKISLREAIFHAGCLSTESPITFARPMSGSTIVLNGTSLVVYESEIIDASALPSGLIIDGDYESRVFTVLAAGSQQTELIGLTIRNGLAPYGGGVCNCYGTLTVTDCTLVRNTATGETIPEGRSKGGGIASFHGSLTVKNSRIVDNVVIGAYGYGGGIHSYDGSATITNSKLLANAAIGEHANGGGIHNDAGTLVIENSLFVGNSAPYMGGGIYGSRTVLSLANSTLTENSATHGGGVCYTVNSPSSAMIVNTVISGNDASSGPEIKHHDGTLSGSHNFIGNGSGQTALINGENGNIVGTSAVGTNPRFIRVPFGGADGWGDDRETPHIDESANDDYGDLRLRPDSPAIDIGDNSLLVADLFDLDGDGDIDEPVPFDLAGNSRVRDGDGGGAATVDIGAYEFVLGGPVLPGDLNGDGVVSAADLDLVRGYWGQNVSAGDLARGDANGDGTVDRDDLSIVQFNWGETEPVVETDKYIFDVTPAGAISIGSTVVYGPAPKDSPAAVDAVFSNLRMLAEAAWADAIDGLRKRRS